MNQPTLDSNLKKFVGGQDPPVRDSPVQILNAKERGSTQLPPNSIIILDLVDNTSFIFEPFAPAHT